MSDRSTRVPDFILFAKHHRVAHRLLGLLGGLTLLVSSGCSIGSGDPVARSADELQALNEVRDLSYKRLTAAVARLDSVYYRESVNLQEFAVSSEATEPAGSASAGAMRIDGSVAAPAHVIGTRSYVKTQTPASGIRVDSTNTSIDVAPSSVIKGLTDDAFAHNGPRLPFDLPPAYVSEKRINDYSYARSDTTVDGISYHKYVVSKIGEPAATSPTTTLLVAPDSSREVIQLMDRSRNSVFLFRTENDVDLGVALIDSTWLPSRFRFALHIKAPFRKERSFVVDKRYSYR